MDEESIIASFRFTYGAALGWSEHHVASCPETEVLRFADTGPGTFWAVLKCPHHHPIGYEVLPFEEEEES